MSIKKLAHRIGIFIIISYKGWVYTEKILCDAIVRAGKLSNVSVESSTLVSPLIAAKATKGRR